MISTKLIKNAPDLPAWQTVLFSHVFFALILIDHAYPERCERLSANSASNAKAQIKSALRDLGWDRKTADRQVNEAFRLADDIAREFSVHMKLSNCEVIPAVSKVLYSLEKQEIRTMASLKRYLAVRKHQYAPLRTDQIIPD